MSLPTMGTISYGDATFNEKSRSSLRASPVWDDARMTIIAVDHTIQVRGYVSASGSDTETDVFSLYRELMQPGLRLKYQDGIGFGDFDINSTSVKDADWGPRPTLFSFVPLGGGSGGNQGALVEWAVTTRIPVCSGQTKYEKDLMALNYDWTHDIDGIGLSKITISGYLEIPLTRQPNKRDIKDNADKYRDRLDKISSAVPTGYRRENARFHMTANRKRLNFSWQWNQLPWPLPKGCSYVEIDHEANWSIDKANIIRNVFTGSITVSPEAEMKTAMEAWKIIVANRIGLDQQKLLGGVAGKENDRAVIIDGFSVRERICGDGIAARTAHFFTSYSIFGAPLPAILRAGGFWQPIGQHDHGAWKGSLQNSTFSLRGHDGVEWRTSDEKLIDLCDTPPPKLDVKVADKKGGEANQPVFMGANANRQLVPKEGSWIAYVNDIIMGEDNSVAIHKPLSGSSGIQNQEKPEEDSSTNKPTNPDQSGAFPAGAYGMAVTPTHPNETTSAANIFQRVGAPSVTVWMVGKAIRLGHRIPTPRMDKVAGKNTVQMWQNVREWVISAAAGIPIFCKTWAIEYEFATPPSKIPVPANPAHFTGTYDDV